MFKNNKVSSVTYAKSRATIEVTGSQHSAYIKEEFIQLTIGGNTYDFHITARTASEDKIVYHATEAGYYNRLSNKVHIFNVIGEEVTQVTDDEEEKRIRKEMCYT